MPRAFGDFERERLRGRLIETGKRHINRSGVRGFVVDDVTRETGISKGSFYTFFPSKEDFLLSVFEAWEEEFRSELWTQLAEGTGDNRDRLERFFLGVIALFDREPGLAKLGFVDIMHIIERLPPERLAEHQANDKRRISEAARTWVESGLVTADDLPAIEGIMDSLFILAMHREDFKQGGYDSALHLMAEALAMRLASKGRNDGTD